MPITAEQRERRRNFIGSSDAAAILGLDPWKSAADVYLEKIGALAPEKEDDENDAKEVGNAVEESVLRWFGKKRGLKLVLNDEKNSNQRTADNRIQAANFDAFVEGDPTQAVEAKTTGVIRGFVGEEWGEVGTQEVPERVALQCQHQMAVVPTLKKIWVPVLMGGVGLRYYFVDRDEKMIADLTEIEFGFWNTHVLRRVIPQETPSMETLKRIIRQPNKTVTIPDEVFLGFDLAKQAARLSDDAVEEAKALLLAALGDAEAGELAGGGGTVTYFETQRAGYTVQPTTYRQLRFKKARAA